MSEVALQLFGGLAPRVGDYLIPSSGSTIANNCLLRSGELRGLHRPILINLLTEPFPVDRVFRVPTDDGGNLWVPFENKFTSFLKGPLVNDRYDRYYWTDSTLQEHTLSAAAAVDKGDSTTVGIAIKNHTFSVGDTVIIDGTTNYDDTYTILSVTTNEITITETYIAETFDGSETATLGTPIDPNRAFRPMYNTLARLVSQSPPFILGAPKPVNTPSVSVVGGSGSIVTRAYVYTWVSPYGEEGLPSNPVVQDGYESGSWNLSSLDSAVPDAAFRASGWVKRVYRTITGISGVADYFYVADVAYATTTYSDTSDTNTVALNSLLQSLTWSEPPANMRGLVAHPNGYLVGFNGRDIMFSEPYRPHAWPVGYTVSTNYDIVGLAVFGESIMVCTNGLPYVITGTHPAVSSLRKLEQPEPCIAPLGIVSIGNGVVYPSTNGLMFGDHNGITNVTKELYTRDEWQEYDIYNIKAAIDDGQYVAFDSENSGFIFSPNEPSAAVVELSGPYWNVSGIQADPHTGQVFVIFNNSVYLWNQPTGVPIEYLWRSKLFVTNKPVNFGAANITWDLPNSEVSDIALEEYEDFNIATIMEPLNPIGMHVVGSGDSTVVGNVESNKLPLGGSQLFNLGLITTFEPGLTVRVYANGRLVISTNVSNSFMRRLPSGYKADRWQFEFIGNVNVQLAKFAETGKGLARV